MYYFVFQNFLNVSARFASRLSTLSKSINKSKETKETSLKIRPRIKSLSKEHPPEKEQVWMLDNKIE